MDDMRQHISHSRRWNGNAKPRLCNTAAERYRQSTRPRGSDEPRGALQCVKKPSRQAILPQNRPNFRVIARPQRGRGNLEGEGMASRGEAREHETRGKPYHKRHGFTASFCFLALYLWFCFVPRNHISLRNDKSFRQRLPRRAQRMRPPRNDRIGRFDRKHGTQNPILGFRKAFLICCLILTVPDFFDSLKRPRGSDESWGRCCLCGKLCAADFRKLSTEAFGRSFGRTSHSMLSVGASAGLHGRCVRSVFQPSFQATMESPYLIIS